MNLFLEIKKALAYRKSFFVDLRGLEPRTDRL